MHTIDISVQYIVHYNACTVLASELAALNTIFPWLVLSPHFLSIVLAQDCIVYGVSAGRVGVGGWGDGGSEKGHPLGNGSWERPPSFINQGNPRHSPRLSLLTASLGWRWGMDCDGGREGGKEGCVSILPRWQSRPSMCVYMRVWVGVYVCVDVWWGGCQSYQKSPRHKAFGLNHNTANYLLLTRKNERGPRMKKKKQQGCQEEVTHWLLSMCILQAGRCSRLPPLYICRRGAGQHTTWRENKKLKCHVLLGGLPLKPGTCAHTITHTMLYSRIGMSWYPILTPS